MRIVTYGASNSLHSINKKLAYYASSRICDAEVVQLDINQYEFPIFSVDREKQVGIPAAANQFVNDIQDADGFVISFAEHNGHYPAAYKNLFDWVSRINRNVFGDKPALLLSTSPGAGGGASVLAAAMQSAPYFGLDVKGHISIPSFYENYNVETDQLMNQEMDNNLKDQLGRLMDALKS